MELQGFKSFGARKVTLNFDRGFTVVTGPNGSGKSNVIDAIRFALGETSPRALRADKFSDVISDRIPPESKRQTLVRLYLDNVDREIPVDTDTVIVSRTVNVAGESVYRLNGKRASRTSINDALGVAGLRSAGVNIIMQGAVTRLSDLAPEERRRVIEDIVGISQYDLKKAEAQGELHRADINLRIAEARIAEVRSRMENLEKERNDALRFNFLKKEVDYLNAVLLSYKIQCNAKETENLSEELNILRRGAEDLTHLREELRQSRSKVEAEWRRFDEDIVNKGGGRLVEVQTLIGDINAKAAGLEGQLQSNRLNVQGLLKLRRERVNHVENLKATLKEASENLRTVKRQRDKASASLEEKRERYNTVSSKLRELRQQLQTGSAELEAIEGEIVKLGRELVRLDAEVKGSEAKASILNRNLRGSEARRKSLIQILDNLKKHLDELAAMKDEEEKSVTATLELIKRSLERRKVLDAEVSSAHMVAERARRTVSDFETQLSFAENVATEDRALIKIEEMGEAMAIPGIYGRLRELVKLTPSYRNALESTAGGWMKALVVKDLETARRCVESLKRTKLGRIKIIPLEDLRKLKPITPPEVKGIAGVAASFVKCNQMFRPAVRFIFGDTLIAADENAAFAASRKGYRTVTAEGDLYEAGGVMESGYYRVSIDISQLIPSDEHVSSLNEAVARLEDILKQRERSIKAVDEEIGRLREELVRREATVERFKQEIAGMARSIERVQGNLNQLSTRIDELNKERESEVDFLEKGRGERTGILKQIAELERRSASIRSTVKPSAVTEVESKTVELINEVNLTQQELTKLDSDFTSLQSRIEATLSPELEKAERDLRNLDAQIEYFNKGIEEAGTSLEDLRSQLQDMGKLKEELSQSLSTVKDETRKFQEELSIIDARAGDVDTKWEPLNNRLRQIELEAQSKAAEKGFLEADLQRLGFQSPLDVEETQVKEGGDLVERLRTELTQLGSINQLAITQYTEQKDNYKQLSIRLSQLEQEKLSILRFMEEIERDKRRVFLDIYNKVNDQFSFFFSKLTGGGKGWLQLQNLEEPFAAGVDLFAEFPGKASRLISSASGGEKSVAALSFLFAISQLQPAPFYLLDEVDAHLDPVHVERLADLVKDFAKDRQFIVVSLKETILDRADRVYGVFAQDGASRVVSPVFPK